MTVSNASSGCGPAERREQPAYSAREAASILGLPVSTVKAWCFGQNYRDATGSAKRFKPLIEPADARSRLLSFSNLCELHLLAVIRRGHRIALPRVRESLEYLRTRLGSSRPLLDTQFQTNGIDLFVEHASKLVNVSQQGQQALRGDFERALARIERNDAGQPVRLFPFTRAGGVDGTCAVVVDPLLSFGRPVLAAAGVKTDVIQSRFSAGDSIEEIAGDYCVAVGDIEEALRFEQRIAA